MRAAAAEALVPVADALLAADQEVVGEVREILWDILLDLQELSTSTASVMHLLAKLYSDPACQGNRLLPSPHLPNPTSLYVPIPLHTDLPVLAPGRVPYATSKQECTRGVIFDESFRGCATCTCKQ